MFKKNNITIISYPVDTPNGKSLWMHVSIEEDRVGKQTRYKGECKDINTFRYIIKLLGI